MFDSKVMVTIDVDGRTIFADVREEPEALDVLTHLADTVENWSESGRVAIVTVRLVDISVAKGGG